MYILDTFEEDIKTIFIIFKNKTILQWLNFYC